MILRDVEEPELRRDPFERLRGEFLDVAAGLNECGRAWEGEAPAEPYRRGARWSGMSGG